MFWVIVLNALFSVCLLYALGLSIKYGYRIMTNEDRALREKVNSQKKKLDTLSADLADVKKEGDYLGKKLTKLSKLYTITKEMSCNMRLAELCNSLRGFLKDDFSVDRCMLVLLRKPEGDAVRQKTCEVGETDARPTVLPDVLDSLIGSLVGSKEPAFLETREDLDRLGVEKEINNLLAIPLMVMKDVIGLLIAVNIDKQFYDEFLILAPQIALQTERIRLFDDVERFSITDGLTGTYLRRYLLERLEEETRRAKQAGMNLSFIMADLDYFKKCNDSFGHLVGDVVLKDTANIIKENIREIDFVARYGGEEFCILLPEADKASAYNVGERIRRAVERHTVHAYDESVNTTISMGISSLPQDAQDAQELVERADQALYEAKRNGRNMIRMVPQKD